MLDIDRLEQVGDDICVSPNGIITRFYDPTGQKTVVVKRITKRDQFDYELMINKMILDINTIHFIDYRESEQVIVFEDGGEDLYTLVSERVLSEEEVINNFKNVFLTLADMHKRSIFHGDIKLENIVHRKEDSDFFLIDFGLSEDLSSCKESKKLYGSQYYVSPETLISKPHNLKADVYALGIVLFICLAGEMPFEGDSYLEYNINQLSKNVRVELLQRCGVSDKVTHMIERMLEPDPIKRVVIEDCYRFLYQ